MLKQTAAAPVCLQAWLEVCQGAMITICSKLGWNVHGPYMPTSVCVVHTCMYQPLLLGSLRVSEGPTGV